MSSLEGVALRAHYKFKEKGVSCEVNPLILPMSPGGFEPPTPLIKKLSNFIFYPAPLDYVTEEETMI